MKRPDFLVLGMSRAGTRWLSQCFAEHPELWTPPTEIHFFVRRRIISTWKNGFDWYSNLFSQPPGVYGGARLLGEISPSYLADNESASLIHDFSPEVKLICSLRDQSEWLYSAYRLFLHFNPQIFHTNYSFSTFLTYSPQVFGEAMYMNHINRYLELFPRENFFIGLYDDLRADPYVFLRMILEFLNVDSKITPTSASLRINPMELRVKRSYKLDEVMQREKHKPNHKWLTTMIDGFNTVHIPRSKFPERHKPTKEDRARIREIYADQNEQLGAFLKRDLSHWNRIE